MIKDPYLVLRLTPPATADEIRSAYRRLALELHPDTSGSGSDPFLELQEAYSLLNDPMRRVTYDRQAEEIPIRYGGVPQPVKTAIGRSRSAEPLTEIRPASGFEEISLLRSFETFFPSFDELFERLWSNFELVTRPKAERVESLTVDVPLSPSQVSAGGEVRILVPARVICLRCGGRGSVGPYECWHCGGRGALTGEYPLSVRYPAGLYRDYDVRLSLDRFGIQNFYLTIRFRPTADVW
jgi:molecular chaperone DnaJ